MGILLPIIALRYHCKFLLNSLSDLAWRDSKHKKASNMTLLAFFRLVLNITLQSNLRSRLQLLLLNLECRHLLKEWLLRY